MRLGFALLFAGAVLAATPAQAFAQKKQRDVITREEIEKSSQKDLDLFTAIKAIRPSFLEPPRGSRSLGGGAMNPLLVVIDGRRDGPETLAQIRAADVKEVRYLDPTRSQNEYGITANSGAIVVKLLASEKKEK
jgi:hypothetical protein